MAYKLRTYLRKIRKLNLLKIYTRKENNLYYITCLMLYINIIVYICMYVCMYACMYIGRSKL